jgi:hypothetical protein
LRSRPHRPRARLSFLSDPDKRAWILNDGSAKAPRFVTAEAVAYPMLLPGRMRRGAAFFISMALTACSASSQPDQDGGTGVGGTTVGKGGAGGGAAGAMGGTSGRGVAGSTGAAGAATGGSTGVAGSPGAGGAGGTGAGGAGAGAGGAGGATGRAGGGGVAGSGGSTGGRGGATGGAGGASICQAVLALDRSCTTAADCFAGTHISNCCGQTQYVGFNKSAKTTFESLEGQCDATYPPCGCAALQPTTDDGSRLRSDRQPGVTCLQGKCTTFVTDCGEPCATGTTCFSCSNHTREFAACTTMCTVSDECHDSTLPLCQMGQSGNTAGKFCTAADVACDTR